MMAWHCCSPFNDIQLATPADADAKYLMKYHGEHPGITPYITVTTGVFLYPEEGCMQAGFHGLS